MRIRDWSSDVCSSDRLQIHIAQLLAVCGAEIGQVDQVAERIPAHRPARQSVAEQIILAIFIDEVAIVIDECQLLARQMPIGAEIARFEMLAAADAELQRVDAGADRGRSEEHTSALQSLMRTSYAALCLKKQN